MENQPKLKQPTHYVNNAEFLAALLEHREKVTKARSEGKEPPPITNYIGDCFIQIAKHLSYKSNFINYSYKDEMISDGIENCLAVVHNFDPAKSKNPFAYFTQIIFYAFVRRIIKEKKQMTTKFRYIDQLDINELVIQEHDNGEFQNQFLEFLKTQLDQYDYEKVASTVVKKTEEILKEDIDPEEEN